MVISINLTEFIPAITVGVTITENERKLLSLAPRLGGLGISIFEEGEIEYQNSIMISEHLCNRITDQFKRHEPDAELNKKKQINSMKKDRQKNILDIIRNHMSSGERKQNDLNLETGASSWLTTLPIKEEGYILNKQSFWVLLSIRYGCRLKRIPSNCACGNTFNLQHALQCPKSGFLS